MKQKKYLNFTILTVSVLLISAFCGCSDSDNVQKNIKYDCYIDSVSTVAVEDIFNVELSHNAVVALSDNSIVDARYDCQHSPKYYLDLKRMGRVDVTVDDAGNMYTLSLTVKSALINWTNYWLVWDADETITCSSDIRQEIMDDIHSNSIVPVMGDGWKLFSQYSLDKCYVSSPDDDEVTLMVSYDRVSSEYVFTSKDNQGTEQRFKFAMKFRDEYGKRNGELKCDMTEYYQKRYGVEKVQFVGIVYAVCEERAEK